MTCPHDQTSLLKSEADALALGLLAGVFVPADAVRWADAVIERLDAPPAAIIDVALADKLPPAAVASTLGEVPGGRDPAATKQILCAALRRRFEQGAVAPAEALRLLVAMLDVLGPNEDEKLQADLLEDELHLASNGVFGSPEKAVQNIRDFLSRFDVPDWTIIDLLRIGMSAASNAARGDGSINC